MRNRRIRAVLSYVLVLAAFGACVRMPGTVEVPDATLSFVVSRSSTHFLLRYVPTGNTDPELLVFDLAPGAEGGTLTTPDLWVGRMDVLTTDCAVVDQLPVRAGHDSYVVIAQDGAGTEVTSADVLDGATSEMLPLLDGVCGSPNE